MLPNRKSVTNLLASFRQMRGQVNVDSLYHKSRNSTRKMPKRNNFDRYLLKIQNLEENIDSFNAVDLAYYFMDMASASGVKYVLANKGMVYGSLKNALKNYKPRELCLMIEFLFSKEQDYLNKDTLQPTILVSGWCNKIYHDSILWADDKYVPVPKKVGREWEKSGDKNSDVKIGEW